MRDSGVKRNREARVRSARQSHRPDLHPRRDRRFRRRVSRRFPRPRRGVGAPGARGHRGHRRAQVHGPRGRAGLPVSAGSGPGSGFRLGPGSIGERH